MTRWLLIAAAAFASGCEPDPMPLEFFDPITHVHAMLVAGSESASVFITRPAPGVTIGDVHGQIASVPVHGAIVTLRADGLVAALREDTSDAAPCVRPNEWRLEPTLTERGGCYVAHIRGGILPGGVYDLAITLPGGESVRGTTTVPRVPIITAPDTATEFNATLRDETVKISWVSARSEYAEVEIAGNDDCRISTESFSLTAHDDGGSVNVRRWPGWFCYGTGVQDTELLLSLYDSSYAAFRRELARSDKAIRHSRSSFGLTGAVGIFGSVSMATLPVRMRWGEPAGG